MHGFAVFIFSFRHYNLQAHVHSQTIGGANTGSSLGNRPGSVFGEKKIRYRLASSCLARTANEARPNPLATPSLAPARSASRQASIPTAALGPSQSAARSRPPPSARRPPVPDRRPRPPVPDRRRAPRCCSTAPSALLGPAAAFDGLRRRG
jgi:hypothetical protein